jgi:hypothetical protein
MSFLSRTMQEITNPYVVACEDMGHAALIWELLQHRNLMNCDVGCPSQEGDQATGITAIPHYLGRIRALILSGKANLTGIMVVADADASATTCFTTICAALHGSNFSIPSRAFNIEGTTFRTAAFILPGEGRTGTLEHLLWDAAILKTPKLKKCISRLCRCTGGHINSAPENKKAKMKISAIIASHCQKNPFASSGMIWHDRNNPIPIDSPCFEPLADFLTNFLT